MIAFLPLFFIVTKRCFVGAQVVVTTPQTVAPAGHRHKKVKGEKKSAEKDGDGQVAAVAATAVEPTGGDDMEVDTPAAAKPTVISRFSPMLFFESLNDQSFVVVERPWLSIIRKFPAPLYRPRYGT